MNIKVKYLFKLLLMSMAMFATAGTIQAATVDVRVSNGNDDAEQYVSSGNMNRGSTDLEFVNDGGDQIVGIRFRYVQVPKGSTINNVYIEFEVDETDNGATNLVIAGEDADWAKRFSSINSDISNRTPTTALVLWNGIGAWNFVNEKKQTPDLSTVVQEIVNREGWSMGNPMAFLITGSGKRVAESYNGESSNAPLLHIDYTPPANAVDVRTSASSDDAEERGDGSMYLDSTDLEMITDGTDQNVGLRFQGIQVPAGVSITNAYIEFAVDETSSGATNLTFNAEDIDDGTTFGSSDFDISSRTKTSSSVEWNTIPSWSLEGEKHRSPDLSAIVQEVIGRGGWTSGNDMNIIITGSGQRIAEAWDGDANAAPQLRIEYLIGNFPYITVDVASSENVYLGAVVYDGFDATADSIIITNSGNDTLNYSISDDAAWLSLSPTSGILAGGASTTINITYSSSTLSVGTYPATVTITDTNATNSPFEIPVSLEVQAIPVSSSCSALPVYIENKVAPAVLLLLDVSSSMNAMMPVSDPASNPQTPDIATAVKEIVDRASWVSGNAISFIITGTSGSLRRAYSFNGNSGSAPLLHVEYTDGATSGTFEARVIDGDDDGEQSGSSVGLTSSDLELINDGSDQTIGIRFRNVTIPNGATITNAYIEFTAKDAGSNSTSLVIKGEDTDNSLVFTTSANNITSRTTTTASIAWNNVPAWDAPTMMSRIEIGKAAISDIVKNQNIDWGYGTWAFSGYDVAQNFTKVHLGTKTHDAAHQMALQTAISSTVATSGTPLGPSLAAAINYFAGSKADEFGDLYNGISCQDKFLIDVTDGMGYSPYTDLNIMANNTTTLCDEKVTPVAVGFGLSNAVQLQTMSEIANERGNEFDDDSLFALHNEDVNGKGEPFLANNATELATTLSSIVSAIEGRYTGSAPAPTTSADDDTKTTVIVAEFSADGWTGDLKALQYNSISKKWDTEVWSASAQMPASRAIYTGDGSGNQILYTDSLLANDNFLCKNIGDIINSSPIIVKKPAFYYNFDNYPTFKNGNKNRDPMVYVGSNDGMLHGFLFDDTSNGVAGEEMWGFVPYSMQSKLNQANTPAFDMCDADDYCHMYFVDGSPIVADIYAGSAWKTILISGLREGGESYFAIDVTSGIAMGTTGGASYLWEFTDTELGESWGETTIQRVDYGSGKAWAAFMGSGYVSSLLQPNKSAYLFGIQAYDAEPLWVDGSSNPINKIQLSSTQVNDALASPLAIDVDGGASAVVNNIYVGNLHGTMYRVNNIGRGETPAVTTLLDLNDTNNQIRAKAGFAYEDSPGKIRIYFGTGKYEVAADKFSTARQYFFGLKENAAYDIQYIKPSGLSSLTITANTTNTVSSSGDPVIVGLDSYTVSDEANNPYYDFRLIRGLNANKESFALRFHKASGSSASERYLTEPVVVGGVVLFTTFTPISDPCSGGGQTWIYALDYETGLTPTTPVFDINNDGYVNDLDRINVDLNNDGDFDDAGEQGIVPPIISDKTLTGLASRPRVFGDSLFITTTNGGLSEMKVEFPSGGIRLDSWRGGGI